MVDEKKDIKTVEPVKPVENTQEGDKSKTVSELDRADQIAERQKRENDRREELINREEAIAARKAVGGIADAGKKEEVKEKKSNADYANEALSGNIPEK